uniref:Uncharacterized protein n=1 Tax=Larimichthys crocea TaxID=215358 RepID=A0A0F8AJH4_LARCR
MASKLNPNVLYVAEHGEPLGSPQADSERTHIAGEAGEESSDSDGEQEETSHKLIRKVSTSGQIRAKTKVQIYTGLMSIPCVSWPKQFYFFLVFLSRGFFAAI